jgi:molybdopterin-guanine dinucleotide biosynthesis protein A
VVEPLWVVAAPDQRLPDLPDGVRAARDDRRGRGPLEAIHAGLRAVEGTADAAYVTSCDVPLLVPAFVERMLGMAADHRVVVPVDERFQHPLAAVYRTDVLPQLEQLRAAGRMRPVFLFDLVDTLRVPVDDLREVDPDLATLANVNTPDDYLAALNQAGLAANPEVIRRLRST